jgi:hypothetical protein
MFIKEKLEMLAIGLIISSPVIALATIQILYIKSQGR